ncbi:MAG: transposase [Anaerolineae bacterium]
MDQEHRRLPHIDVPGLIQGVTFHLADSMPANLRREWKYQIETGQSTDRRSTIQAFLDQGYGSCLLRQTRVARIVQETLEYYQNQRYRLLAWVIMPNHLHFVLAPLNNWPLATIVRDIRSYSTRIINIELGRQKNFGIAIIMIATAAILPI